MKKSPGKVLLGAGVLILLGVLLIEGIGSMVMDSPTFDEGVHLAAGYCYLRLPVAVFDPNNPPLPNVISALPLLWGRWNAPSFSPSLLFAAPRQPLAFLYSFSQEMLYRSAPGADPLIFRARIPGLFLAVILGVVVFEWSRRLYGPLSGLTALFFFVFSPNLIAHSRLVTNDMGGVLFMVLAVYFWWRALKTFRKSYFIFLGLASGYAAGCKYTALILFPIFIILLGVETICKSPGGGEVKSWGGKKAGVVWAWLGVSGLLALLVVVLIYKFNYFQLYFEGLISVLKRYRGEHPAFLWGQYRSTGWWYYFIVTFLIKTPVAMLAALILVVLFRRRISGSSLEDEMFLLLPAGLYFITISAARINIGHRHILFIYPLLFVFASKVANLRTRPPCLKTIILAILLAGYAISSLSVYPHYIAYFNRLVGGPKNGHKYLSDSNIDWGQDLKRLGIFLKENDIKGVYLSYFGEADPAYYGIDYQYLLSDGPLPPREFSSPPERKYLAISVKCRQGVSFPDHTVYNWLEGYQPCARIGSSIFFYDLTGRVEAYLRLASLYALTRQWGLAERELQDVLAIDPANKVARKSLEFLKERGEKEGRRE